jgi:hypothetical protein
VQVVPVLRVLGRGAGGRETAIAEAFDDGLDDGAGLREVLAVELDHGRLAERMHGAERRGREHGLLVARVPYDLVRHAQLLKQPQHPLRPGVVEMVDTNHGPHPAPIRAP